MELTINIKEETAIVVLARQPMNAFDLPYLENIYGSLKELEENSAITFVIIKSGLKHGFSSGLDLRNLLVAENYKDTQDNIFRAVVIMFKINKLVVKSNKIYFASLQGPVIGSAASLSFACDFRLASVNTWFWLPDPMYGGLLADGGIELLIKLVGKSRAAELILSNIRLNATEATKWGLLHALTTDQELDQETEKTVKRFRSLFYQSLAAAKQLLNKEVMNCFEEDILKKVISNNDFYKKMI